MRTIKKLDKNKYFALKEIDNTVLAKFLIDWKQIKNKGYYPMIKDSQIMSLYFGIQQNGKKYCFSLAKEDSESTLLENEKTIYNSKLWKGKCEHYNQKRSFGFIKTLELIKIGKYFIKKNSSLYIERILKEKKTKSICGKIVSFGIRERKSQLNIIDLCLIKRRNQRLKSRERMDVSIEKKVEIIELKKNDKTFEKQRMFGKILFWNYLKRYGWIITIKKTEKTNLEENVFYLKYRDVKDYNLYIQEGIIIEFTPIQNEYGLGAIQVTRANTFHKNTSLTNAENILRNVHFKPPYLRMLEKKNIVHLIISEACAKMLKKRSNSILPSLKETTGSKALISYNYFNYFEYGSQVLASLTGDSNSVKNICQIFIEIMSEISQRTKIEINILFSNIHAKLILRKKRSLFKTIRERLNTKITVENYQILRFLPNFKFTLKGFGSGLQKSLELLISFTKETK